MNQDELLEEFAQAKATAIFATIAARAALTALVDGQLITSASAKNLVVHMDAAIARVTEPPTGALQQRVAELLRRDAEPLRTALLSL